MQFLAQACEDAIAGGVDGTDAEAEFLSDGGGRAVLDHHFPARLPGGGLEVGLHQFESAADQVPALGPVAYSWPAARSRAASSPRYR